MFFTLCLFWSCLKNRNNLKQGRNIFKKDEPIVLQKKLKSEKFVFMILLSHYNLKLNYIL